MTGDRENELSGDGLVAVLAALSNPHRVRILAELARDRAHVSELARRVGISRPLLYLHLRKLEAASLISGRLELSADGKAMKFFEILPFSFRLTPAVFARAATSLTPAT
jgi:predicted transcriptional regulator